MSFYSPLRYPGGKGKLLPFFKKVLKSNNIEGKSYAEPYAGGAGIGIGLLIEDYVDTIHINDADYGIYCFWKSLTSDTESFLRKLWDSKLTIEEWRSEFHKFRSPSEHSELEIGFAAFYLNRTNRSGVLRGGVIGGLNQSGKFKIDARFNKKTLSERIVKIGNHSDRIFVYNCDAITFIEKFDKSNFNSIIFIDPPYFVRGKQLYRNSYEFDDHKKVSETIKSINRNKWILTYDNTPEIRGLYNNFPYIEYDLKYSLNLHHKAGQEVLFHPTHLFVPARVVA